MHTLAHVMNCVYVGHQHCNIAQVLFNGNCWQPCTLDVSGASDQTIWMLSILSLHTSVFAIVNQSTSSPAKFVKVIMWAKWNVSQP